MCVHHTKNYRRGLLRLIEFEARGSVSMDREERLRRRREQARLRRAAETPEQREARWREEDNTREQKTICYRGCVVLCLFRTFSNHKN